MTKKGSGSHVLGGIEKKIIEFELANQERKYAVEVERIDTIFKDLKGNRKSIQDAVKRLVKKKIYKRLQINEDLAKRFLNEGDIRVQYWIFVKLDYYRADIREQLLALSSKGTFEAPEEIVKPVPGSSRTDKLIAKLKKDMETDNRAAFDEIGVKFLDVHNLLGYYFDLALIVQAKDETALANFLTQYFHKMPEVAHTHTATNIYYDCDFDPEQELDLDENEELLDGANDEDDDVAPAGEPEKRYKVLKKKKAVLKFLLEHPEYHELGAEPAAKILKDLGYSKSMNKVTYGKAKAWFIKHGFIEEMRIDNYIARYVLLGRWPVRYLVFVKAARENRIPSKDNKNILSKIPKGMPFEHALEKELKAAFDDLKPNHTRGITMVEIRKLIGFEYSMVLTVLADHEDAVGDFVTGYLHSISQVLETHTVTILVPEKFRNLRRDFEISWPNNHKSSRASD